MNTRIKCVLCYEKLSFLFKRDKYPITVSPPIHEYESDIFLDQQFYSCENCSCVQLGTLIEPEILYNSAHNNTSTTPTWKEHHKDFSNFIDTENTLLEIGGSGILFRLLREKYPSLQYSCLDICEPTDIISDIIYHKGNCESFSFSNTTLVMSHVFEHLYNPRQFVENIHSRDVQIIYISIPNMMHLVRSGSSTILHNEHTFFIDKILTEWLFSQYGYTLVKYSEFINHSLFFKFQKNTKSQAPLSLVKRPEIVKDIYTLFVNDSLRFSNIQIQPYSFILPAGLFGQFVIHACSPKNIIGFIDNDSTKHNKRVYGTPYNVYPFEELKRYNMCTIYILAGPYKEELIHQIHQYNNTCKIIEL